MKFKIWKQTTDTDNDGNLYVKGEWHTTSNSPVEQPKLPKHLYDKDGKTTIEYASIRSIAYYEKGDINKAHNKVQTLNEAKDTVYDQKTEYSVKEYQTNSNILANTEHSPSCSIYNKPPKSIICNCFRPSDKGGIIDREELIDLLVEKLDKK